MLTATGILTGPGTADEPVPEEKTAAVLSEFSHTITGQKLPFGISPTTAGARGSDVIIEGIASGVTDRPRRVQTIMSSSMVLVLVVIIAALGVAYVIGRLITLRAGMIRAGEQAANVDTSDLGLSQTGPTIAAFLRRVVRTLRRGPQSRRPGLRRATRSCSRRNRHGRQSRSRQAAFGPVPAHHHHLRRPRAAAVPHERGPQGR